MSCFRTWVCRSPSLIHRACCSSSERRTDLSYSRGNVERAATKLGAQQLAQLKRGSPSSLLGRLRANDLFYNSPGSSHQRPRVVPSLRCCHRESPEACSSFAELTIRRLQLAANWAGIPTEKLNKLSLWLCVGPVLRWCRGAFRLTPRSFGAEQPSAPIDLQPSLHFGVDREDGFPQVSQYPADCPAPR